MRLTCLVLTKSLICAFKFLNNLKEKEQTRKGLFFVFIILFLCPYNRNAQIVKLNIVNWSRTFCHRLRGILYLRVSHNITKALTAEHLHAKSVKTYCHAAVGRCAVTEGVKQIAELFICLFL